LPIARPESGFVKVKHCIDAPLNVFWSKDRKIYTIRVQWNGRGLITSQESSITFARMKRLIKWIILINQSVLIRFKEESKIQHDYFETNHEIIDWVFNETFHPKSDSLPITGNVEDICKFKKGKELGSFQLVLLSYLSATKIIKETLNNSLLLLSLFYQLFKPEIRSWIEGIDYTQTVVENLAFLTYRSFQSQMKMVQQSCDGKSVLPEAE
jgi:hypothetical protein